MERYCNQVLAAFDIRYGPGRIEAKCAGDGDEEIHLNEPAARFSGGPAVPMWLRTPIHGRSTTPWSASSAGVRT
ncbi:hypothetical protein [Streptomyces sp. NPDC058371]|uniref:hypothetical protein n=1 Tax=Streptomyces sp. NPDC058371 TaxID=3346463 RepID=UPI00364CB3DB